MVKVKNLSLQNAENELQGLQGREDTLTLVIRDDTDHVTSPLKDRLINEIQTKKSCRERFNQLAENASIEMPLDQHVNRVVNNAYQIWLRKSLYTLGRHLDADKYDLNQESRSKLFVHLYNADELTGAIIEKADDFDGLNGNQPYLISLDDMIHVPDGLGGDISFSRLFSLCGRDYFDYTARPGYPELSKQMAIIRQDLQQRYNQTGQRVPIVLLEDNVRHARMLNWLELQMDDAGLFDNAYLAGISTCFCSADNEELLKIQHRGQSVPVAVGVNYLGVKSDVQTPRDLLFDGFVVEIDGQKGRLPGIFMDVASRFSVTQDRADEFTHDVRQINREFCADIQKNLGVNMPLSWFVGAKPVSHVTNTHTNTSMMKVMK